MAIARTTTAPVSVPRSTVGVGHPRAGTDPALLKSVKSLVEHGAKGRWFDSASPFDDGARNSFFVLTSLPAKADPKSPVMMMRTDATRAFVAGLMQAGAPLILGAIPNASGVGAAALGREIQLAGDALKAGNVKGHQAAILIKPDVDKMVLAHEFQHWKDFEDPKLDPQFTADLKPLLSATYMTLDDKQTLYRTMWELRGHNAQALQALSDQAAGVPYLNGAGPAVTAKKPLDEAYSFEVEQARSIFIQTYQSRIATLATNIKKHDPAALRQLKTVFARYDLSNLPGAPLSFGMFVR